VPWAPAQGDPAELGGYRLSGQLGAGGMGRVYLAFTPGGRPVAVKVLRPELGDDPEFRARFRQEIVAARRVSGLFTAQVLDADPDGSPPWLVTAYVAGPSLAQAVATHGPLPERSVLLLAAGVAEALQAIHGAGLVHRDLKPSNVLLAADGPRVIDFGIARAVQAPALTRTGLLIGSPQFMAPEQVQGGPVATAADVFALGALVAYAATGRPPFGDGEGAAVLYRVLHSDPDLAGCPGALLGLIQGCLAQDPRARAGLAQVIGQCRALVPAGRLEFTASWLPAAIVADLPRHAAPRTLPLPPATGPDAHQPVRQHRRLSRAALAGAVVAGALVAALAGYGLASLTGATGDDKPTPASGGTGAPDQCVLGTWTMQSETDADLPVTGGPATFTGHGPTWIFFADGVTSLDYGDSTTMAAQLDGVIWTIVYTGGYTARYATRDGMLLLSDESEYGTYTVLRDGSYYASNKMALPPRTAGSAPYSCSAGTLRVSAPGGLSYVLSRN
jgi:serine/threonine kinase PknH